MFGRTSTWQHGLVAMYRSLYNQSLVSYIYIYMVTIRILRCAANTVQPVRYDAFKRLPGMLHHMLETQCVQALFTPHKVWRVHTISIRPLSINSLGIASSKCVNAVVPFAPPDLTRVLSYPRCAEGVTRNRLRSRTYLKIIKSKRQTNIRRSKTNKPLPTCDVVDLASVEFSPRLGQVSMPIISPKTHKSHFLIISWVWKA